MNTDSQEEIRAMLPTGDLTIFEAAAFRDALINWQRQAGRIDLDLSRVDCLDTSCVQLILAAIQTAELTLSGVKPEHREHFKRVGCGDLLRQLEASHQKSRGLGHS